MGFERSVFFWGGVSLPLGRWTLIQSYGNGSFRPSSITCNLWTMASQAFVNPVWGLRVVWSIRQWFPAFFLFGTVVWSIRSEGCLVVCFFSCSCFGGSSSAQKARQPYQARAASEGVVAMRGPQGQMMLGDGRAETAEVPTGVMETKGIFQWFFWKLKFSSKTGIPKSHDYIIKSCFIYLLLLNIKIGNFAKVYSFSMGHIRQARLRARCLVGSAEAWRDTAKEGGTLGTWNVVFFVWYKILRAHTWKTYFFCVFFVGFLGGSITFDQDESESTSLIWSMMVLKKVWTGMLLLACQKNLLTKFHRECIS